MKLAKLKRSLLICSTAIATLLTGCGGEGEQIPIRPHLPAAFQRSTAGYDKLMARASHWEVRVQPLPDGKELVRTLPPQDGAVGRGNGLPLPVQLPPSTAGQWEITVRLFDKKGNGQVRGFAILEGKKKVTDQELKQVKAVEIVMHFHAPTED